MTAQSSHAPLGGKIVSMPFLVCAVLVWLAFVVLAQRFIFGLDAATNLNDGYPWGIWITIDLIVGTGLGCAGYAMALLVYILNRGQYHPLVRPALLASLLGYTLGGLAVFIDLGRYWQMYNIMLPWLVQYNSVMLETALCIGAYVLVLVIELSPAFLERFRMKKVHGILGKVLFVFTALGVLLPTMHQSSLGSILIVLGHQLSPLWQSQLLPLLFLISALFMGWAVVVFEAVLSSVAFKRPMETRILGQLTGIMAWTVVAFLVLRVMDLTFRADWGYAFAGDLKSFMFWIEMALHVAAVALVLPMKNRTQPRQLFSGASLLLVAAIVYRTNAYLIGYQPGNGWQYFPSLGEIIVSVGIVALEIMLYMLFVKHLPVLHRVKTA